MVTRSKAESTVRRGGRRALAPEEKRSARPRLALTDDELTAIAGAASRRGLRIAVWLREIALAAAGVTSAVPLASAPPPVVAALVRELARIGVNLNQLAHSANRAGLVLDNPASSRADRTAAEAEHTGAVSAATALAGAGGELAALVARIEAAFATRPALAAEERR